MCTNADNAIPSNCMFGYYASADKNELLKAIEGHILANTELMGTFSH